MLPGLRAGAEARRGDLVRRSAALGMNEKARRFEGRAKSCMSCGAAKLRQAMDDRQALWCALHGDAAEIETDRAEEGEQRDREAHQRPIQPRRGLIDQAASLIEKRASALRSPARSAT